MKSINKLLRKVEMKDIKRNLKSTKGFTLIELIVIIAILAVLAVIAVPRLVGYQDRARASTDRNNASIIGNAVSLALTEGDLKLNETDGSATGFVGYEGTSVDATDLSDVLIPKYLESIPQPQSVEADDYTVNVNANGTISITAGGETFYPITDAD